MPEPALDPVADHGAPDGLVDHEADPGRAGRPGVVDEHVQDQGSTTGPPARPHGPPEGVAVAQPLVSGEHGTRSELAQTARLLRPLRRREEMMARPARVRMRRRNPCTLWRRRLFGW